MKDVKSLFEKAINRVRERGYDNLYVAIDVHGTIIWPSRHTEVWVNDDGSGSHEVEWGHQVDEFTFYPNALPALSILSNNPHVKIILWTSTQNVKDLIDTIERIGGIHIDFLNQNPDFQFNSYADFSKKFCFDVLLDDKAGFDPMHDWGEILKVDFSKLGGKDEDTN